MKLVFLGTRGEIEARTRRHRMHSSLLVSYRSARVMIDCGLDWLGKFERLRPSAIVLTHAHPDHAWGLKNGAPCPVYAPEKTWQTLQVAASKSAISLRVYADEDLWIMFEAFPVEHSILAPAVGYRVSAGHACIFDAQISSSSTIARRAQRRADLHRRRRNPDPLVHSQARKTSYRACTGSHAADMVQKGGCAAGDYHPLRSEIVTGDERKFRQASRNRRAWP